MLWLLLGIGFLSWSLYELYDRKTWAFRTIYRNQEPLLYWIVVMFWLVVSLSILIPAIIHHL